MANENETQAPEASAPPQMTLDVIRELLVRLNNPEVPIENRQMALTGLFVEFLDRVSEMKIALGNSIKRLTEQGEKLDMQGQECVSVLQTLMKDAEEVVEESAANGHGASSNGTTVPTRQVPGRRPKTAPVPSPNPSPVPVVVAPEPPPPPLPADAAAAAATLNNIAGVPVMPLATAVVKS